MAGKTLLIFVLDYNGILFPEMVRHCRQYPTGRHSYEHGFRYQHHGEIAADVNGLHPPTQMFGFLV